MPYETEEDSNPEKDQNQLMDTENLTPAKPLVKEGMGIAAAPENYQPATPRYIRADDDSKDGQDTDEEGDIEATYLAPTQTLAPKLLQDGPIVQALLKERTPQQKTRRVPQVRNQCQSSLI